MGLFRDDVDDSRRPLGFVLSRRSVHDLDLVDFAGRNLQQGVAGESTWQLSRRLTVDKDSDFAVAAQADAAIGINFDRRHLVQNICSRAR